MYTLFYGLDNKPFEMNPDPSFLWQGGKIQKAYDTLRHGILECEGFLLLTGGAGSGKTTLIQGLTRNLGANVAWALVSDPKLERIDFYNAIARGFGIEKPFTSKVQFLIQFSHFLHKADDENKRVVLLVDDCHLLSQEMLEELRLLANIEKGDKKLINILFAARPSFNEVLLEQQNRAIAQRVVGKVELEPFTVNETEAYIGHRLQVAGSKQKLFSAKAVQAVQLFCEGVPGRINGLCDYALASGYMQKKKTIDNKVVELAVQRLGASPSRGAVRMFNDENGQPIEAEDSFEPPSIPITPPFTGFNLEKDHRRVWPQYLIGALIIFGAGGYFWLSEPSPAGDVEEKLVVVNQVPIVQAVVQVGSSPAVTVLEKSNSSMDEQKAAELKIAILEKAYDNSDKEQQETGLIETVQVAQQEEATGQGALELQEERAIPSTEVESGEPALGSGEVAESTSEVLDGPAGGAIAASIPVEESVAGAEPDKVEPLKISAGIVKKSVVVAQKVDLKDDALQGKQQVQVNKPTPLEPLVPLVPEKAILGLRPDSLKLTDAGRRSLDQFIAKLKRHPRATVFVKGFVSAKTNSPENILLSEDRALSVRALMMAQGIDAEQIEVVGMGNQEQIASNDTREGRRKNRRVEIHVISDGT